MFMKKKNSYAVIVNPVDAAILLEVGAKSPTNYHGRMGGQGFFPNKTRFLIGLFVSVYSMKPISGLLKSAELNESKTFPNAKWRTSS